MKRKRILAICVLAAICLALLVSCAPTEPADDGDNALPSRPSDAETSKDDTEAPKDDTGTTGDDADDSDDKDDTEADDTTIDTPSSAASFEVKEYRFPGGSIKYWLYTPANAREHMPMIVYLHGGSGRGDDPELITSVDGFPQYLRDGKLSPDAYVIVPQVSSAYRGWGDCKANVFRLISFVTQEYRIDADRVSLTGHSMGGSGAWMLALSNPDLFSAVAPLSGSVALTDENLDKLKGLPAWAFVGSEDTIVDPQSSIDLITALAETNPNAKLTVLDGADHFAVPSLSYLSDETDLVGWLISQKRQ